MPPSQSVLIAFGANLGQPVAMWKSVLTSFSQQNDCNLLRKSRLYQTSPVGAVAGTRFTNGAFEIDTTRSANGLLQFCHQLENEAGRERSLHWGPRPLDLDLIFYGSEIIRTPELTLPHPAAWHRRFVLDPLLDIAPDRRHPERKLAVRQLQQRLLDRPLRMDVSHTPADSELRQFNWEKLFPAEELLVFQSPGASVAVNHATTLSLISREEQSEKWEQADIMSRYDVGQWQNWSVQNTIDLLHTALDQPIILA